MSDYVLAADLGGTNMRAAVVDSDGKLLHRIQAETPGEEGFDAIVAEIVRIARYCISQVSLADRIISFGLAVPAIIDFENAKISKSPNIPALNCSNLAADVSSKIGLPVILENDATAAGVGEHWLGASQGFDNAICVTLGTGVGGGLILDGKVLRGADGTAGEIGHICVEPFGHPCGCGSQGCLEQYASATAVVRLAKEKLSEFPDSKLNKIGDFSAQDVFDAGIQGDKLAIVVFSEAGFYLGIVLAGLINLLNPGVIVIAGGASAGWDLFIGELREQVSKRAFQQPAERVKIVRGKLGDDAGILGVARLAFSPSDKGSSL